MPRRPWHRWTILVTPRPNDESSFAPDAAAVFNRSRRWFVFRRNARLAARFYEGKLGIPLNFYVVPIGVADRRAVPARFPDAES